MKVHLYEKLWMSFAIFTIVVFITMVFVSTFAYGIRPPSHVDMIDPRHVLEDPRFQSLGVSERPGGGVQVTMAALMFAFLPAEVRVPAGRPVHFRITSVDVTHGFEVAGSNANTMVVPGYVSEFTITFDTPGERLVVCNEYCGNGHHAMQAKVIVEPAAGAGASQ
jgi:cytochrome c oxidase subunit 2